MTAPSGTAMAYGGRSRRTLMWIATHAAVIVLAVMFLAPLAFMFLTAVMSDSQALSTSLWPKEWHFENFRRAFSGDMVRWTVDSTVYAALSTALMLVSSVPVAYALARFRFRGRNLALVVVISAMMLPPQVTMIPTFIMFTVPGWIDSLKPLIVPAFFGGGAFFIFLLRQFFLTIPGELEDAARIDGCSSFGVFRHVILPLSKPALTTVALFSFIGHWNDFLGPLIYTQSMEKKTLAVGLSAFNSLHGTEYHLLMAASVAWMPTRAVSARFTI